LSALPYLVSSDQHCHPWSPMATIDATTGINTRLQTTLAELERSADELIAAGGRMMVLAGDLFHTRGSIDPECFNPTHATIKRILARGIQIYAIPGNHDLKGNTADQLSNAMQTFDSLEGFNVITSPTIMPFLDHKIAFIPWERDVRTLAAILRDISDSMLPEEVATTDVIIHAGINEVKPNMPASGLNSADLAAFGFRRIFAGHYHDHKVMEGGKVISIGATTHHTFGDVGTKAGYIIAYPDRIDFRASHAPEFIDIDATTEPDDVPLLVEGNFVRVRGMTMTDEQVTQTRKDLYAMGAKGVTIQTIRDVAIARTGVSTTKAVTMEESIANFVEKNVEPEFIKDVQAEALDILTVMRSVTL
jgi:DNA repair exonuclease SbcCD nuclease subunit